VSGTTVQLGSPTVGQTAISVKRFVGTQFAWNTNGAFEASGNIIGFSSITSDSRLKENISPLNVFALDKIMKITAVEFDWIKEMGRGHDVGFIAQDIQAEFPHLIHKSEILKMNGVGDDTEYLTVDYARLSVYLVQAIQELKAEIEILKNK
jgi:hypothetical protein